MTTCTSGGKAASSRPMRNVLPRQRQLRERAACVDLPVLARKGPVAHQLLATLEAGEARWRRSARAAPPWPCGRRRSQECPDSSLASGRSSVTRSAPPSTGCCAAACSRRGRRSRSSSGSSRRTSRSAGLRRGQLGHLGPAPGAAGQRVSAPATRSSSRRSPSRPPPTRCALAGATPVFADIEPRRLLPRRRGRRGRRSPTRTAAIMPVHLYGHPADLPAPAGGRRAARPAALRGRRPGARRGAATASRSARSARSRCSRSTRPRT